MTREGRDNRSYRGVLQSDDGIIKRITESKGRKITFETEFGLSQNFIEQLRNQPEHIVFSERSRIARLGFQITCEQPSMKNVKDGVLTLVQVASPVITGYPGLDILGEFFDVGLPVGRMVFCDPQALLTAEEVLIAIERAELKLPASTSISSDGSIVIAPHRVVCELKEGIGKEELARILLREDGREMLNRYQIQRPVKAVTIPPEKGVITTCSMYLNEHYVVLQSGYSLGRNLPATVLDPIKTRGIRIYLEIVNGSRQPIVNPLISARVYGKSKHGDKERRKSAKKSSLFFSYQDMRKFETRLSGVKSSQCHYLSKPVAILPAGSNDFENAHIFSNGPEKPCKVSKAECTSARRDFSFKSPCKHVYATSKLKPAGMDKPVTLVLKYFPNMMEHRDIVNLACDGKISTIYFYNPSCEHGPFLSQKDHHRLQEYDKFGITIYWVCELNSRIMVHTMRDNMGYFVVPERLADFHKSMFFAFYGSTLELSPNGVKRLGDLMDALIGFWGKNIGIVTGGGSGVMEEANRQARSRGILSGANFLDITDQSMTTDVDFCQVFQATCRHSRQKWFEVTSFPIFNIGGLGSMEELGITLCNMKLSIMEPVPIILFDTEGGLDFWKGIEHQIKTMVRRGRAPSWIENNIIITDNPQTVVEIYRKRLRLF
ncbi:MAG: LOG family protein [Pseudomonadota bacterium]